MSLKGTLTNEKLTFKFENPFQLVRHAIGLADQAVTHGEGMEMHLATDILEEIAHSAKNIDGHDFETTEKDEIS